MIRILFSFIFSGVIVGQVAPTPEPEKPDISINFIKGNDELLLNWSVNTYLGYPVYQAQNFKSVVNEPLIPGSDEEEVLDKSPPGQLHAYLGIGNKLFDCLQQKIQKDNIKNNEHHQGGIQKLALLHIKTTKY